MAQPTIEDLKRFQTETEAEFGKDTTLAYADITMTQMSIARHYGGMRINGKQFIYNWVDDSLIREDVARFLTYMTQKESKKGKESQAGQKDRVSDQPLPSVASECAGLVSDLRRYQRVADTVTRHELTNAADAIERLSQLVDEANQRDRAETTDA